MAEQSNQLKKLINIATDMELSAELRTKAIALIGNIGTREALLTLLDLAANENLITDERDLALRHAREIIKSHH
jgi:HEAT repeat protein